MDAEIASLARRLSGVLSANGRCVATAESCTGGWLAKVLTDVPGSSAWFGYGYVTYSNRAKRDMLDVTSDSLTRDGAVSERVVAEMAEGALRRSGADLAVAISGIAGPDGGSEQKPVGTVWFAWAVRASGPPQVRGTQLRGDRDAVRRKAVAIALQGLLDRADS